MTQVMKQLVSLRRKRMTGAEAARRMKISRQHLCNLEKGHDGSPSIRTVERYAKAVGAQLVVEST